MSQDCAVFVAFSQQGIKKFTLSQFNAWNTGLRTEFILALRFFRPLSAGCRLLKLVIGRTPFSFGRKRT